jgi:signal transduction histidine kinase
MTIPRSTGLRARATLGFGATGLVVALALATSTYLIARSYLVDQRLRSAEQQVFVNARLSRAVLRSDHPDVPSLLAGLGGGTASDIVLRYGDQWYSSSVALGPDALPGDLVAVVSDGHAAHQRDRTSGELRLTVGVPVAAVGASYFEVFSLAELERTLSVLVRSLALGVLTATVVAAAVGRLAANRLVRPLAPVADAAERIAGGALDTRLDGIDDPDLVRLTGAFNSMAASLERRVELEARFAADVSHELRSPLTAIAAAVEIIERRREQLPPQVVEAVAVLVDKVDTFQRLVLDLLEISTLDAGRASLTLDPTDLRDFVDRVLARHDAHEVSVHVDPEVPQIVEADRRRLAQAMGNLVENARNYAGGVTDVRVTSPAPGLVRIAVGDRGPGVPPGEREAIFGRFSRGEAGRRGGVSSGSGLGLALVEEHARLHGGRASVEDRVGGGAMFVIEIAAAAP